MTDIALAPDVEHFLNSQLANGAYRSREEILNEALRTLRQRNEQSEKRAALIADIEAGLQSLDQGNGVQTSACEILASHRAGTPR
jgi:putative addiction module CopG family antidote